MSKPRKLCVAASSRAHRPNYPWLKYSYVESDTFGELPENLNSFDILLVFVGNNLECTSRTVQVTETVMEEIILACEEDKEIYVVLKISDDIVLIGTDINYLEKDKITYKEVVTLASIMGEDDISVDKTSNISEVSTVPSKTSISNKITPMLACKNLINNK